ncbi:MAG: hypothetical protein ACLUW8_08370 [Subdoligranulum sp.]
MKKLDITAQKIVAAAHTAKRHGEAGPNSSQPYAVLPFPPPRKAAASNKPQGHAKSKSHRRGVLSPSRLECGGLYYACCSKNSQKKVRINFKRTFSALLAFKMMSKGKTSRKEVRVCQVPIDAKPKY